MHCEEGIPPSLTSKIEGRLRGNIRKLLRAVRSWYGELNGRVVVTVTTELTGGWRLGREVKPNMCRPFGHDRYENVNDE